MPTEPTGKRLRQAARNVTRWTDERNRLIVERRGEGATLRAIAEEAELSPSAIVQILGRDDPDVD